MNLVSVAKLTPVFYARARVRARELFRARR